MAWLVSVSTMTPATPLLQFPVTSRIQSIRLPLPEYSKGVVSVKVVAVGSETPLSMVPVATKSSLDRLTQEFASAKTLSWISFM